MNLHLAKQSLINRALEAIPDNVSFDIPQEFSDKLIELTARSAIKCALDNDDPITAVDIGNVFGIYQ